MTAEPLTVSFWMASASEERNAFMEDIFEEFHKQNPDITVEYLGVPGDIAQFNQKLIWHWLEMRRRILFREL